MTPRVFSKYIQDYKFYDVLGKGGFGLVRKAVYEQLQKEVAIKLIDKKDPKTIKRWQKIKNEARIHFQLSHPNVLEFYTAFEDEDYIYLVLEYCGGGSLRDLFDKRGCKLSESEVVDIVSQVLHALIYLHSHNIVHRDLSLDNLLFNCDNVLKLSDFGLSTKVGQEEHRTICGTPNFISPEVVRQQPQGPAVDAWSWGILLYTLLVGQAPFHSNSVKNTFDRVVHEPAFIPDTISPEAQDLLRCVLHKDPLRRICLKDVLNHPFMNKYNVDYLEQDSGLSTTSRSYNFQKDRPTKTAEDSIKSYHRSGSRVDDVNHRSRTSESSRRGYDEQISTRSDFVGYSYRTDGVDDDFKKQEGYVRTHGSTHGSRTEQAFDELLESSSRGRSHVGSREWSSRTGSDSQRNREEPRLHRQYSSQDGINHSRTDFDGGGSDDRRKYQLERSRSDINCRPCSKAYDQYSTSNNYNETIYHEVLGNDDVRRGQVHSIGRAIEYSMGKSGAVTSSFERCNGRSSDRSMTHSRTFNDFNSSVERHIPAMSSLMRGAVNISQQLDKSQGSKPIQPLSTIRLLPRLKQCGIVTYHILKCGDAVLARLIQSQTQILRVSSDGLTIVYEEKAGNCKDNPPEPSTSACRSSLQDLPAHLWDDYHKLFRFVRMIQSATPKIEQHSATAKYRLMEDCNTFLIDFNSGTSLKKSGKVVTVNKGVTKYNFDTLEDDCRSLDGAILQHFKEEDCELNLVDVENHCIISNILTSSSSITISLHRYLAEL